MKTKMKSQGSNELPRFAVGALAIAGASAANAATVQITFNGSYISSTGGNQLDTDIGDDGSSDIRGLAFASIAFAYVGNTTVGIATGGFGKSGAIAGAVDVRGAGNQGVTATALKRVSFTDSNVRGGLQTTGYVHVTAEASASGEKKVTLNRLIFDDATGGDITGLNVNTTYATYVASAVPEPSSLGLLALGAGGLLARRRRAMAA